MESNLDTVLTFSPFVTLALAAIGLATVFNLFWKVTTPILSYLTASAKHMLVFWCVSLIVIGSAFFGYSQNKDFSGYGGVSAVACGVAVMAFYWLRRWVRWCHGEKD